MHIVSPFSSRVSFAIATDLSEEEELGSALRSSESFGPKRQREFLLGRAAAARALKRFGYAAAEVARGPKGEPLWPQPICGSISHKGGIAVAAVGAKRDVRALGVDVELESARGLRLLTRTASATETAWVMKGDAEFLAMLLFSTKESIYKALYPLCQKYFGFEAVELSASGESSLRAELKETLSEEFPQGFIFETRFARSGGCIVSGVELPSEA